jgi:uncharacterized protein YPO0396
MRHRDNAPIGNTCPDIDDVIQVLAGVADRLDTIADRLEDGDAADDLTTQSANLRQLFEGRRSQLEELRSANESLRNWGNKECERADDAEDEVKSLRAEVRELESYQ